ncbi:hypothetical protein [Streptomyces purpurascens]|uniref:hypothetical protein n=1 Tax=Streptomyces purpurascens TaxID=1924 RepID=UPI0019BB1A90|nr:hypothetical protein [Streptomyces purpurascens]GHA47792.1 hypothetical protein GCM10010303_69070 [Streptomyces purpurascens]
MSSSPLALTDLLLREFVDGFRALLGWWAKAGNLTPVGWQSAQAHVRRHLANRARVRRLELLAPDLELPPRQRREAITAGRRMVQGTDLFAPRFRDIHAMAAEGPEERTFALPHALMPFSQARIPEYQTWHRARDFTADYR